jgi:hypothetical protein
MLQIRQLAEAKELRKASIAIDGNSNKDNRDS